MDKEKLKDILNKHRLWLDNDDAGERADLSNTDLRWANWHEAEGIKVYVAGLQSSRENAQLTYIPSIDVATTGCFQGTWKELKERVANVYKKDNPVIFKKYTIAIKYIEKQVEADE